MAGYAAGAVAGGFERSRALFEGMVEGLTGEEAAAESHADLEKRIELAGRELLRQLFQDHVDLRALRERRQEAVVGADGVERTRVERGRSRELVTVFGPVTVTRMAYRRPGTPNLYPADAAWSLPAGVHSHGLRQLVAIESSRGAFDAAQAAVERATGVRVGKRQVEQLPVAAAADIERFYALHRPQPAAEDRLLALTCDAKGVVMRPEALRAATAKAAAKVTATHVTRLSQGGERTHRKRMAELACVYDAEPVPRTVDDVIRAPGDRDTSTKQRGPQATGKWLTASITDDAAQVICSAFDEAERRDPDHKRTWVVLVDGNDHQLDVVATQAAHRGVRVHIVLDLVHVTEYVWGAARSFFDTGDPAAEAWTAQQLCKILDGKARHVAAGIRRRATTFGYNTGERAAADKCAGYLTKYSAYLRYDHALAHGWPIATGVTEGACPHLVKDRLDITGARWGLPGAEAILRLRAVISNGDFDTYWRYHQQQEHERVHASRYQQSQSDYALVG